MALKCKVRSSRCEPDAIGSDRSNNSLHKFPQCTDSHSTVRSMPGSRIHDLQTLTGSAPEIVGGTVNDRAIANVQVSECERAVAAEGRRERVPGKLESPCPCPDLSVHRSSHWLLPFLFGVQIPCLVSSLPHAWVKLFFSGPY